MQALRLAAVALGSMLARCWRSRALLLPKSQELAGARQPGIRSKASSAAKRKTSRPAVEAPTRMKQSAPATLRRGSGLH